MKGQLDFFELIEEQYAYETKSCMECENCKQTQMFKAYVDKDGVSHFQAFCNPTRQVITDHTASWLCKNRLFERRTSK